LLVSSFQQKPKNRRRRSAFRGFLPAFSGSWELETGNCFFLVRLLQGTNLAAKALAPQLEKPDASPIKAQ
jgi:hypothetical protein